MHDYYRLIQYRSDPFIDTTFTIGALVQYKKSVVFYENPNLPPASYMGKRDHANMHIGLDTIKQTNWITINQLPDTLGPHFLFGTVRNIPLSAPDNLKWVKIIFGNSNEETDT